MPEPTTAMVGECTEIGLDIENRELDMSFAVTTASPRPAPGSAWSVRTSGHVLPPTAPSAAVWYRSWPDRPVRPSVQKGGGAVQATAGAARFDNRIWNGRDVQADHVMVGQNVATAWTSRTGPRLRVPRARSVPARNGWVRPEAAIAVRSSVWSKLAPGRRSSFSPAMMPLSVNIAIAGSS